jgi:hypothetical protein
MDHSPGVHTVYDVLLPPPPYFSVFRSYLPTNLASLEEYKEICKERQNVAFQCSESGPENSPSKGSVTRQLTPAADPCAPCPYSIGQLLLSPLVHYSEDFLAKISEYSLSESYGDCVS